MILESEPAALWGGVCDECDLRIIIDGDGKPVPGPAEWEEFPRCPVCGSTVSFDGFEETQWNRETRLMKMAAEREREKAENEFEAERRNQT